MSCSYRSQRGVTLVELMVALTLGLLVVSAVVGAYLSASRNHTQDERIGRMQENARHAMRILSQDLSMISFWGPVVDSVSINGRLRDCTTTPDIAIAEKCAGFYANSVLTMSAGGDCGPGTSATPPSNWAFEVINALEIVKESSPANAATKFGCIDPNDFQTGSDVLVIKRVQGRALAADRAMSADNGRVFLRTNGDAAMLLRYDSSATAATGLEDWEYLVRVYYIQDHFTTDGDGIPTLFRKTLDGNNIVSETGGVAQGIEYFHVLIGIDADGDGVPDYYVSQPTNVELRAAVTARVYVLARSIDPVPSYTNDKTYQLGDITKDYSANPDNFYRRVFMTTVQLRNQVNRNRLRS